MEAGIPFYFQASKKMTDFLGAVGEDFLVAVAAKGGGSGLQFHHEIIVIMTQSPKTDPMDEPQSCHFHYPYLTILSHYQVQFNQVAGCLEQNTIGTAIPAAVSSLMSPLANFHSFTLYTTWSSYSLLSGREGSDSGDFPDSY